MTTQKSKITPSLIVKCYLAIVETRDGSWDTNTNKGSFEGYLPLEVMDGKWYDLVIDGEKVEFRQNNSEDENDGDGHQARVICDVDVKIAGEHKKLLFGVFGTYSSWDSSYWDYASFVEAYEVPVTRYRVIDSSSTTRL